VRGSDQMSLTLIPFDATENRIVFHVNLFKKCFPSSANLSQEYLRWLYLENPIGKACGFDAFEGNELVATYVCIPSLLNLRGASRKGLLSLNTATAPSHQGRGLFTKLATNTYDLGYANGYDVVYGVANQNSIGGFIRKLGFQDVSPLDVRIGLPNSPKLNCELAEKNSEFFRLWDQKSLAWRLANPKNPLRAAESQNVIEISGDTNLPFIGIKTQVNLSGKVELSAPQKRPFELYLGKTPEISWDKSLSIAIPNKLKPSPLRLIFKSLGNPSDTIAPENTFIRFIDFDAF
jgi:hypothetical protein